jgi:hypothetical protein
MRCPVYWSKWKSSWDDWHDTTIRPALWARWRQYYVRWFVMNVLEVEIVTGRWVMQVPGVPRPGSTGRRLTPERREELNMALLRMEDAMGGVGSGPGSPPADQSTYPLLWEHVSEVVWPDGTKREPSTMVIVADNGGWRGCLSDKANGLVMWKTGDSLQKLLNALEKALREANVRDWRRASVHAGKKKS